MKRLQVRLSCIVGTLALAAAISPLSTPGAQADPGATPAISWNQLGLSNRVELVGSNQSTDINVPVPQGVSPRTVTGQLGSVVNATGRVDVLDSRGTLLGSVAIPTGVAQTPFRVNTAAAQVKDGVAKVSFVLRADDQTTGNSCSTPPSVILSALATTFSGPTPNPVTVADFLPGYVDQITIHVGPNPTRDQQQAALSLVGKLTRLYRPMPVRIDVDTSPGTSPAVRQGIQRTIVIRDGDRPAIVVEKPGTPAAALAIYGSGPELLRQVELFADRRLSLAQTSSASVTSMSSTLPRATNRLSFADLGISSQASVIGASTMYIGFDASRFAVGPIEHASIHLKAKYTPVTTGDASLLLRAGNDIIASRVLNDTGVVDLTGDIPPSAISSNVGLALELRYIPEHDCAPMYDRITFSTDPDSIITVTPGDNNRGGFPVLPMAFTPEFDVALDSPDQIRYAAQAINLMAQQSATPLEPNVTTLDEAAKRGSGLLVVAPGEKLDQAGLRPPLLMKGAEAVEVNGRPQTGIDLHGPLGVIQVFSQNGRTVLAVSTSGDGTLTDRSFDYIRGVDGRWASLNGDVIATGAAGTSVNLTVVAGGPMTARTIDAGWRRWVWFTIGLGAVAFVTVAGALIVRRRRTTE